MKIGNDVVKIERMQKVLKNKNLFNRIFTPLEQGYVLNATNLETKLDRMAGKVALKEAVAKAFGVGICKPLAWKDVETDHNALGKPVVLKNEKIISLLKQNNLTDIDVSISHEGDYAFAVCVVF